ncbi:NEW3 domain-containing protein [Haloarcula marina]|uniref:NEW3 domain-containing protein n=1 Tax=Haloarcula marina TaxID=2961574 RepID=UPI0020B8F387|nr:NEW3 domain-containing protein [Halomicroarcula marina]
MIAEGEDRSRGWVVSVFMAVLVVLATVTAPVSVAGSSVADSCREINGHRYCLVDVWTEQGTVAPGQSVNVHAVVENRGSKQGSISTYLGIRRPDGSKTYPSGDKAYDIAVGERVRLDYTAEIPSDAPEGDYELTVDVWTGNDAEMFDTSGWLQQFSVEEPTIDAVTSTDAAGTYAPGEDVPIDVTVENTGDTTHEFYVDASLQRPNGDWVTGEGTTVELRPGAQQTVTLDATVPDDADEGSYTVGSAVFYSSAKDERFGGSQERDAFVVDEPTTDAAVTATTASGTYTPGERVPIDVTVENTGDTTHEFYVDASLQRPNGDWVTGEGTTVGLRPGAQQTVTLDATVPDGADEGSYTVGSGVFHSSAKDERYDYGSERDAVTVDEPTTAAAIVGQTVDGGTFRPGETVPMEVTVENTGDTTHEFYVDASLQRPNGDWVTGEAATPRLSPGEREAVALEVRLPDDADEGTYGAGSAIYRTSRKTDRYDGYGVADAFVVDEPTTDAAITHTDAGGTYAPGENVPIDVTVENTGETTRDFYVDASLQRPNGNWVTGEGTTVGLRPGAQRTVTLDATVPDDAAEGRYTVGAGVFRSSNKDEKFGGDEERDAFVVEEPTTDAAITTTDAGGTYAPGERVPVDVTVENTGDTTHEFYVDASLQRPNGDWVTGEGTTVELRPGAQQTVTLDATVPDDASEGSYTVGSAVFRSDAKDERFGGSEERDAFVVEEPTASVTIVEQTVTGQSFGPGEQVPVEVTLANDGRAGASFYADASLRLPDGIWVAGEGRVVELSPNSERTVTLDVVLPDDAPAGEYDAGTAVYRSAATDERVDESTLTNAFDVSGTTNVVVVDHEIPTGTYYRGETIPGSVTVENTGTATATLGVRFALEGVQTRESGERAVRDVDLRPGERRTIAVDSTVPDDAPSGSYDGVLTVERIADSGRVDRIETLRSQDDITISSDTVTIESVDVTPDRVVPGDSTTVAVTLASAGAQATDVTVRVALGERTASRTVAVPESDTRTVAVELTAPSDGLRELAVEASPERGQTVTYTRTLATANATLSGVVVDASGAPVTDATVTVDGRETGVDRSGQFRLADVPAGTVTLEVVASGVATTRSVTLESGSDRSVEIQTGASGSIRAVDAPPTYTVGEPISIPVTIRNDAASEATFTLDFNDSGASTLEVRPVTVPPGETRRVTREVVLDEGAGDQTIGVELRSEDGTVVDERSVTVTEAPTLVQVTVVTPSGDPVAGADLGLGLTGPKPHTTNDAGIVTIPLTPPSTTFSADDGPVDSWTTMIQYAVEGYGVDDIKRVDVRRGATTRATIELPSRSQMGGRVTADGERLTDVEVFVGDESAYVDQNGRFEIDEGLSPGRYYVRVKKNDEVVLNTITSLEKGYTNVHLEVPASRYESATGLDNYVRSVVDEAFRDDGTAMVRDEIYGEVTEADMTVPSSGGSEYFVADDGSYYTSGPCAWYNSEDQCEASKVTEGGTESTSRALNEGVVSGFIYGGEETINGFKQLLKPIEYLSQLFTLAMEIIRDLGLIEELMAAIPQQINEAQRTDNPYDAGKVENETFANGWYGGYGSFLLVSSVASSGAASATSKAFSTSSKFSKVANKASDLSKSAKQRAFRRQTDGRSDIGDAPDALDDLDPEKREQLGELRRSGDLNSYLAATGEQGATLLNRLDGPTATRTVRQYNAGRLDGDAIRRTNRLLDSGDMDQADVQRLLGILETKADDPLVDQDLTADDLLKIADSGGNIQEAVVVTKRGGEPKWIPEGSEQKGMAHIEGRHIDGELGTNKPTDFFPVGQRITRDGVTKRLDAKLSREEVKRLIARTIRDGDIDTSDDGPGVVYTLDPEDYPGEYDIGTIRVVTGPDGDVITAYPKSERPTADWSPETGWNID